MPTQSVSCASKSAVTTAPAADIKPTDSASSVDITLTYLAKDAALLLAENK